LIAIVVAASLLSFVLDLVGWLPDTTASRTPVTAAGLLLFAGLAVLSEHLAVDVGDRRGKISVSAVGVVSASFLYGEVGSLATVLALATWAKVRAHSPLHRMLFNFGTLLLAAEGATWTFHTFVAQPVAQTPFDRMLLPAVAAGLVYYTINHVLLCLVRGLTERRPPWLIWVADYQWLWPHYAVFGALGLVVALAYVTFDWTGVLALMAPVAMMHLAIKQYRDRTAVYVEELQRLNRRLSDSYDTTLQALTRALDTRDEETEEHSQRVSRYTELLARRLGIPDEEIQHMARGALLHDIGKIGVPDAVLLKSGSLDDHEQALMRKHPTIGYAMITHIPFLGEAAKVVLHHHEAYDGSGYPSGLAGDRIPLGARIFAVADALDAMTSDRPYRRARSVPEALAEIKRCRGTQFDPQVVDTLLAIPMEELLAARDGVATAPAPDLAETPGPALAAEPAPAALERHLQPVAS
jgi:putative nucleotidyltransferase with HDIG domain